MRAGDTLAAKHGVSAEVVGLRTLVRLDVETIVESAARTRRAVVADFVIRIPRVSVAVAEAKLLEMLVDGSDHVEEGAGASGTVQWTGTVGVTDDIGAEIGRITP